MNIKEARKKVEERIYKVFDIVDKTGQNTEYYKAKFAKMSDTQFKDFFNQDFPLKFQSKVFDNDPTVDQIMDALHFIKVPIEEKVSMPFINRNKEGKPVKSQPVLVVYMTLKRLKQMVQKKTGYSVNISKRDYRTGLLIDTDKNGNSTDREFESLVTLDLPETMKELSTYRADSMTAKAKFYNQINLTGMVSQKDVPVENDDSIARNLISAYLIGAHINSNLVNKDDYLPRTLEKKNLDRSGIRREQ